MAAGPAKGAAGAAEDAPGPRGSHAEVAIHDSPALAEIFAGLDPERGWRVLDLGPAVRQNLDHYAMIASRVRFVDLLSDAANPGLRQLDEADFSRRLEKVLPVGNDVYDLILTWSSLDYLDSAHPALLARHLASVAAPGARLHAMVVTTPEMATGPVRYEIVGRGRIAYRVTTDDVTVAPNPPPAKVERWLEPFRVQRSFILRHGVREFVAVLS